MSIIQAAVEHHHDSNCGVAPLDYAALYAACGLPDQEKELCSSAGKTKPCTKFFSTSGCPYGESCHFLHFVAGGITALGMQLPSCMKQAPSMNMNDPSVTVNGYKTRLCNRFNTPEGCRFADNCHFAHGEADVRRPFSKAPASSSLMYAPPASYNNATLLQSADAAYNNGIILYNFDYTYSAAATSSFNYPTTSFTAVSYPPSSTFPAAAQQPSSCLYAEPTPPGVTVPSTSIGHEAALTA